MSEAWLKVAEKVIRESDHEHPADRVLRETLKSAKSLTPEERTSVSEATFAYYRWKGWLLGQGRISLQIQKALELEGAFTKNPDSVREADLSAKTVPEWIMPKVNPDPKWFRSLQEKPRLWIRSKREHQDAMEKVLDGFERPYADKLPESFLYTGRDNLFRLAAFQEGWFELQDISSQAIGRLCHPKANETWWDACAGEGGKMLHLSDLMGNKGMIWATDPAQWRLDILKKRAGRAKAFNYRTALWVNPDHLPTKTRFDGILVDAPCSGVGTWHRNPHARWTLQPRDVDELSALQEKIVAQCVPQLKSGARLIYSVCTLTNQETHGVCDAIEKRFPSLKPCPAEDPFGKAGLQARHMFWPQDTKGGGMFAAVWKAE